MRKIFGHVFIDVGKYVLTGMVITSLFSDMEASGAGIVYALGGLPVCVGFVL
jgi:hypothetical protein